jgi:glycosyltransferase involved in cell wall biosynthesis
LQAHYPRLRVVHNATNGGYGRALASAVAVTRGAYIITIDSDGQFDLADAFVLFAELERGGYDGVTGWRMGKKDSAFRVLADHECDRTADHQRDSCNTRQKQRHDSENLTRRRSHIGHVLNSKVIRLIR